MNQPGHLRQIEDLLRPVCNLCSKPGAWVCLSGAHGSSLAWALAVLRQLFQGQRAADAPGLIPSLERPWLIVAGSDEDAERIHGDLQFFYSMLGEPCHALVFFPAWETLPYEGVSAHIDLIAQRMQTLHRLADHNPPVVVTSVPALIQRLLPPSIFADARVRLQVGRSIERDFLITSLLRVGYRRVSVVEIPGEFCVRGGIIDIYSTAYAEPLRLEFLGDTIESARLFETATQKSTAKLEEAWVLPAREFIPPPEQFNETETSPPPDAEWRAPLVYPEMATLLDYFGAAPVTVLDQPLALAAKAEEFHDEVREAFAKHQPDSAHPPYAEPAGMFESWSALIEQVRQGPLVTAEAIAPPTDAEGLIVSLPMQSPGSVGLGTRGKPFSETLGILEQLRGSGLVLIVARSRGQLDRLQALLSEHDLPATKWHSEVWHSRHAQRPPFHLIQGDLTAGFVTRPIGLAVITEEELFAKGLRHRPSVKTKAATFLSSLDDLNAGDYVVHVQHGIGRYQGLRRLTVNGFESDYLILQFSGGDTLYVPLDRLNQVQRYRSREGHAPKLDRLGGSSWARTKAKVRQGIEEMAQELVELYANRELASRVGYHDNSTLTHEFEAAFEFEETPDQLRAIDDIRRDLESSKPMDRLVCGDVGYGKTEVAMRAAFTAVQDNRQVAVLVPTTLLAQQHYDTFAERFASFPVRVAMFSRFQRPQDVKQVLRGLADGAIDIVIGTHRLLQRSVQFQNLGLVIIDEEQWFGVRHKERLKQLRTQVDVLTLTATPIPRTLQMAFSGVRDLSVIETPPSGRLAIRCQILRFNESVIRDAVMRELGRGGQTFFVHNRVQSMQEMAAWLQQLIPEARITMAHGQMDERLLESVMLKFVRREVDVLVTSAIIQSGLDVPNANTILINRADTFGLAQLYQLRGRVGRAGHQAYAYFLLPNEETLSTDAQKRLQAIQEFTELGSGFRIAAADLEIRGAGNLLGKQQSGHIAAVGLDLYMQMVEQAVQELKGQTVEEEPDPSLHLNVSAYIPETYVEDAHQRLSLYKRLSTCLQVGDLALLHGEIQDRYGPVPDPVERLIEVMQIKLSAKALRIESVETSSKAITVSFDPKSRILEEGMRRLMDQYGHHFHLRSPLTFEIDTTHQEWPPIAAELRTILKTLRFCDTKSDGTN